MKAITFLKTGQILHFAHDLSTDPSTPLQVSANDQQAFAFPTRFGVWPDSINSWEAVHVIWVISLPTTTTQEVQSHPHSTSTTLPDRPLHPIHPVKESQKETGWIGSRPLSSSIWKNTLLLHEEFWMILSKANPSTLDSTWSSFLVLISASTSTLDSIWSRRILLT